MESNNNPIPARPILPSTSYGQQTPRSPDPRLVKIIAELGLRFRPLTLADQEAHAAQVALLTRDLAGTDVVALQKAADQWARNERFMPKAADLLKIVRLHRPATTSSLDLQYLADMGNAKCTRPDLQWVVRNGDIKLEPR